MAFRAILKVRLFQARRNARAELVWLVRAVLWETAALVVLLFPS
jgi:hypothetical protein